MNVSTGKARKRILGSMLPQHIGDNVCVLGTLVQLESSGRMLKMKTSDDQLVTVQLQQPPNEPIERLLEVHGTVSANNAIQCFKCIPFATENFDLNLYNEVLDVMSKNPGRYPIMA